MGPWATRSRIRGQIVFCPDYDNHDDGTENDKYSGSDDMDDEQIIYALIIYSATKKNDPHISIVQR